MLDAADDVGVAGARPGPRGDHGLPVRDGGSDEPVVGEADSSAHEKRAGARPPEQVSGGRPQAAGAVTQRLGERAVGAVGRPGLKQRGSGRGSGALKVVGGRVAAHSGPHGGMHPDGARGAGRVNGEQAEAGEVGDCGLNEVGLVVHAGPAGDVRAGGGAGEDGAGNATRVEQGDELECGPGQPDRVQRVGVLDGHRPDAQHGGGAAVGGDGGHVRQPFGQFDADLPAAYLAVVHNGGGLGQAERVAGQVGGQVRCLDPLLRPVGEPVGKVGERLPAAETPDQCGRRIPGQDHRGQPSGHEYLPSRSAWPQAVHVRRVRQVVQYDRPRPALAGQRADEALGGQVGALALITARTCPAPSPLARARDSPSPIAPAAHANLDTIASRLAAGTQMSRSTCRACHTECANAIASCVFPVPPVLYWPGPGSPSGVSTMVWPGRRPSAMPRPILAGADNPRQAAGRPRTVPTWPNPAHPRGYLSRDELVISVRLLQGRLRTNTLVM